MKRAASAFGAAAAVLQPVVTSAIEVLVVDRPNVKGSDVPRAARAGTTPGTTTTLSYDRSRPLVLYSGDNPETPREAIREAFLQMKSSKSQQEQEGMAPQAHNGTHLVDVPMSVCGGPECGPTEVDDELVDPDSVMLSGSRENQQRVHSLLMTSAGVKEECKAKGESETECLSHLNVRMHDFFPEKATRHCVATTTGGKPLLISGVAKPDGECIVGDLGTNYLAFRAPTDEEKSKISSEITSKWILGCIETCVLLTLLLSICVVGVLIALVILKTKPGHGAGEK
eukprot:g5661.t1